MSPNSLKVNFGFCSVTVLAPIFHSQETMLPSGSLDLSVNCTSSPATMPSAGSQLKSATGRWLVSWTVMVFTQVPETLEFVVTVSRISFSPTESKEMGFSSCLPYVCSEPHSHLQATMMSLVAVETFVILTSSYSS